MLRKENGVTLVALIVTIIVMLILASITIVASKNLNDKARVKNLKTSMLLIQAKAEEIYNKYEYEKNSNYPGEQDGEEYDDACEALGDDDGTYTRHLKSDAEDYPAGLKVDSDDFYVNYKTGDVYSASGYDGKHLLSDLKNY